VRMLTLIDEYTRECLAIHVARRLIRSANGPEFVTKDPRKWLANVGIGTPYIEPGSPWENGYCESFNGKLRDECPNGEIFYSLKRAQVVIEKWRVLYNTVRPHSAPRVQAAGAGRPYPVDSTELDFTTPRAALPLLPALTPPQSVRR